MANKLLELIQNNLKREVAGRGIRAEAAAEGTDAPATVRLYDVIDPYFGVSASLFAETMAGLKAVDLHINSPGGNVFEAVAIAAIIANHQHPVNCFIDGLAASSATRVALACKTVSIADTAMMMIHDSWAMAWGNKDELRDMAGLLEKVDGNIANDYARKTGKPLDEIVTMMSDETWFTAQEAVDAKLADAIFSTTQAEGAANWDVTVYKNAPKPAPKDTLTPDQIAARTAMNKNRARMLTVA